MFHKLNNRPNTYFAKPPLDLIGPLEGPPKSLKGSL